MIKNINSTDPNVFRKIVDRIGPLGLFSDYSSYYYGFVISPLAVPTLGHLLLVQYQRNCECFVITAAGRLQDIPFIWGF